MARNDLTVRRQNNITIITIKGKSNLSRLIDNHSEKNNKNYNG